MAGHGLNGCHVDGIDIGPFLPVDLHIDEEFVHDPGSRIILEGLVLHDVAPVARGIANGEEERPILGACPFEGLVTPRVPVHGVVGMLQEVGAGLGGETVGHGFGSSEGATRSGVTVARTSPPATSLAAGSWAIRHGPPLRQ